MDHIFGKVQFTFRIINKEYATQYFLKWKVGQPSEEISIGIFLLNFSTFKVHIRLRYFTASKIDLTGAKSDWMTTLRVSDYRGVAGLKLLGGP